MYTFLVNILLKWPIFHILKCIKLGKLKHFWLHGLRDIYNINNFGSATVRILELHDSCKNGANEEEDRDFREG